jgi:hypothetical protein
VFFKITILLLASGLAWAQEGGSKSWGPQSGAFRLSLSSDRQTYMIGDPINVTVTLRNVTEEPAPIAFTRPAFFYDIDIRLPFPTWMPFKPRATMTEAGMNARTGSFHPGGMSGFPMRPGGQMTHDFELEKMFNMTAQGEYHIVLSCRPTKRKDDPRTNVVVTSNEITITLLAKP